ncbi:MAG: rhomboid family intramembrane serine protease [Proteobacteria bacterium]|uniref:rhomboid family intramembrane serine protease n=1 Tax=Rudaea sp. TaxID=2136325 RepID=UPI0032202786|nr:rhomboid family intramembrane serine protease [Pseudomonadota bacterium]
MFVTVDRQRKPSLPWVTLAVIVTCMALFLWLAISPEAERSQFMRQWGTVPTRLFDVSAPLLQQFVELRWLRLFTGLFIHLGWLHLVGNVLFLMIFGAPAERALGPWRFLLLFLIGGALANLAEAVMLPLADAGRPIVGSSGAVSAIIGAYLSLFPRARLGLVLPLGMFLEFVRIPAPLLIGFWFLLQIAFTFVGPAFGAVAWWAHIAGFVSGVLFALVSRPAIARRLRS